MHFLNILIFYFTTCRHMKPKILVNLKLIIMIYFLTLTNTTSDPYYLCNM